MLFELTNFTLSQRSAVYEGCQNGRFLLAFLQHHGVAIPPSFNATRGLHEAAINQARGASRAVAARSRKASEVGAAKAKFRSLLLEYANAIRAEIPNPF